MDLDSDEFVEKDPTGRYVRRDEILGGGGIKTVYGAFDEVDGVEVAWKRVNVEDVSPEQLERWTSEARLLKSLKNKNIIKFYDFWVDDGKKTLNMITEIFVSGSLSQYCKKHKNVETKAIKNWARQILQGLHYLHTLEPPIILGDLKCDNIFVNGNNGEVKIGDLGLAIVTQQPTGLRDLGTPANMAPEICEEECNELVDVYSFGMCMLEMVTCEFPYSEIKNPGQAYKKVISGVKPASLDKVNDPQVKQFIEKCLVPASSRLPAIELLKDPFLATENSKDTVSGSMKLPDNLMLKQVINLPHSESRSMDIDNKKILVGSCKEIINEKLQFSAPEICKLTEKNEFRLRGEKIDNNKISLSLKITETPCRRERKVEFSFHLDSDTAVSVAEEMVEQLELSPEDAAYNAELIDILVMQLVPGWKTSRGSIEKAPERHPDCLQSVRDQEALQSINLEIFAEHDVTVSFHTSTEKPLGSSHCSLQLNSHNLCSDFRTHDDRRPPEHKKPARRFLGFCIGSCFGMKNTRAGPASATHTKQRRLTS
ncbi:SERINE/THREONINE-PROTEIN KINASE WNK WITH NO LYSINE -RELATED [Salix purpurea]|uniref:non-specific serine/threonine protein kinase n=1 Tax=Salix purpurea TaxID=77065 RepID=A0A9Q0UC13_SALPP|nr:SERINE/THREONINE-PROTEIN KINASE WNK WITH NO LYSINE -RELATED [Salix purpurea]